MGTRCEKLLVIIGLEFTDTFDLTAVGTLALAFVTLISLAIGGRALQQTKDEIAVSRQEVEEAHRPVVVPVVDSRRSVGGESAIPVVHSGVLVVPIENIGTGPALSVAARVSLRGPNAMLVGDLIIRGDEANKGTLALGTSMLAVLDFPVAEDWGERECFYVTIAYADVAGNIWETSAFYIVDTADAADAGKYESVSIYRLGHGEEGIKEWLLR